MIEWFREKSFQLLCYHPYVWRVRPGVRPRGSTGYADSNMGLSEAVILAVVFLVFPGLRCGPQTLVEI
jgi:hypothetical protein